MVHVKALDILAHDRDASGGVAFLEKIDQALGATLPLLPQGTVVAVAADHTTSSESGNHTDAPPPALLWGPNVERDGAESFDERTVEQSGSGVVRGSEFFRRVREAMGDPEPVPTAKPTSHGGFRLV